MEHLHDTSTTPESNASPSHGRATKPYALLSREKLSFSQRLLAATLGTTFILLTVLGPLGHIDTVAQGFMLNINRIVSVNPVVAPDADTLQYTASKTFRLRDLPSHPDAIHYPYMAPSVFTSEDESNSLVHQFQEVLDIYKTRQGIDDNFTVRVLDARTNETLEVYELTQDRAAYERGSRKDWGEIDRKRRTATRRLVNKWDDRGVPRKEIIIKWGRKNQVHEARERDEPFVEYELRLARYLDLSLLPLAIGTVETFNQDWMVSSVGARSRYQMMPYILKRSGIHHYSLRTADNGAVRVREEWHPLLTMEPAFLLMRGYINAVGHEIPGISAYHTGPGNIYKVYRLFFTESGHYASTSTVMDAYMWAVTEGFRTVREQSTFGPYSRGYIASAYGSLRAVDEETVDTSRSLRTVRVQVKSDAEITLGDMLDVLDKDEQSFDWGYGTKGLSTYEQFRAMNPHFDLSESRDGEIPAGNDIRFISSVSGRAVRFFLPIGAPEALKEAGFDVFNDDASFTYDDTTYEPPSKEQVTKADLDYAALVDDIREFGFTEPNRRRLLRLHEKFEQLAEKNPSHYRRAQLQIISTHRRIWLSNPWESLAEAATLATGRMRLPVQPPVLIETDTPKQASSSLSASR